MAQWRVNYPPKRCEHDRAQNDCRECLGSNFCVHQRRKRRCKECHGSGICEHNRHRYACGVCNDFICDACDMRLSSEQALQNHQRRKHPRPDGDLSQSEATVRENGRE